jgi:ankyrin repeat protein
MLHLSKDDPRAVAVKKAIETGDVECLNRLLREHPDLAGARIGCKDLATGEGGRTLLHVAADWPGHFPNGPAVVAALVAAGADVNGHSIGGAHEETPLHWAASSDDVAVLDALLDKGADIEAVGSVIDGTTALADACAFGNWRSARRLIERGAKSNLWQSAAIGLMDRVAAAFTASVQPSSEDVTNAFWCACHGGQHEAAEFLLARGADRNWIGHDDLTPLDAARRSKAQELADWLVTQGAKSTGELR